MKPVVRMTSIDSVTVEPLSTIEDAIAAGRNANTLRRCDSVKDAAFTFTASASELTSAVLTAVAINGRESTTILTPVYQQQAREKFAETLLNLLALGDSIGMRDAEGVMELLSGAIGKLASVELRDAVQKALTERGMTVAPGDVEGA